MRHLKRIVLVLVMIILVFSTGCFKKENGVQSTDNDLNKEVKVVNTFGNTQGNLLNHGLVAGQGNWNYYSDKGIYKERSDGKDRIKIAEDEAWYLNVVGDWIYFVNVSDAYSLYKVKIDGTQKTKMNSEITSDLNVVGDWIYYIETRRIQSSSGLDDYTNLWKMKTDGTSKVKIYDNTKIRSGYLIGTMSNLYAAPDMLYFNLHQYEGEDNGIYKMDTNGAKMELLNGQCCVYANYSQNGIYYRQFGSYDIFRMKYDDSERIQLAETKKIDYTSSFTMNVAGDWIYFSEDGLYKMKTNGTAKMKLSDDNCEQINVLGDWVYFTDKLNGDRLYKIKTDGTVRSRVDISSIAEEFTEANIKLKLERILPSGFEFLKFASDDVDKDGYPEVAAAFEKVSKDGKTQTQVSVFRWNNKVGKFEESYYQILDFVANGVENIKAVDIISPGMKNFVFIYAYDAKNSGLLILGQDNKTFKQIYNIRYNGGLDIDDSDKDGVSEIVGVHRFVKHMQKPVIYKYHKWNGTNFSEFNRKIGYEKEDGKEAAFVHPAKPELVVENFIQSYFLGFKDELEKLSVNDKVLSFNLKNNFSVNIDGGLNYFACKVISKKGQNTDIKVFGSKDDKKGVEFRLVNKDGVWKVSQIM